MHTELKMTQPYNAAAETNFTVLSTTTSPRRKKARDAKSRRQWFITPRDRSEKRRGRGEALERWRELDGWTFLVSTKEAGHFHAE